MYMSDIANVKRKKGLTVLHVGWCTFNYHILRETQTSQSKFKGE